MLLKQLLLFHALQTSCMHHSCISLQRTISRNIANLLKTPMTIWQKVHYDIKLDFVYLTFVLLFVQSETQYSWSPEGLLGTFRSTRASCTRFIRDCKECPESSKYQVCAYFEVLFFPFRWTWTQKYSIVRKYSVNKKKINELHVVS